VYYEKMGDTNENIHSDEHIAERVQKGDSAAFGELVSRYEEKLFRYGRRFLARGEDIEDVVQDVFLKAYVNIQSYNATYRFSPWMYRIAHNTFVNVLRKNAHRSFTFIDFDTFVSPLSWSEEKETESELRELRAALEEGLSKIDSKYREVLILHYFEELSYDEIAEILQIPKGTVGVRLRRGREALRRVQDNLTEHHYGN
jgi:RNA polymerase sigma-70 factor, ECF subfamily